MQWINKLLKLEQMENLSFNELININGGCNDCQVSSDGTVQGGYSVGYHIGKVIGQTISDVGGIIKAISPFSWFK